MVLYTATDREIPNCLFLSAYNKPQLNNQKTKTMKTMKFLTAAGMLIIAGTMFFSCSKQESSAPSVNQEATVNTKTTGSNCNDQCISYGYGVFYSNADTKTITWGGKTNTANSKTVDIEYYNTETAFVLKVRSTNGWSDLVINGTSSWTGGVVEPDVWGTFTEPLLPGWRPCDSKTFSLAVTGNGPQAVFSVVYGLIGICTSTSLTASLPNPVCTGNPVTVTATVASGGDFTGGVIKITENGLTVAEAAVTEANKTVSYTYTPDAAGSRTFGASYDGTGSTGYKSSEASPLTVTSEVCITCEPEYFSYVTQNNKDITFHYNASESLSGAVVVFTFPQIANMPLNENGQYVAPDGKIYSVNNPANQTVFTWTGDIGCTTLLEATFTFSLTPVCNASGKSQVWTDFTVNTYSKKNDSTPSIVYTCP